MKEEYKSLPLEKNNGKERFELKVGEHTAFLEYEEKAGKITLLHTESPPELEGKGAATALIEKTLEYIDVHHLKLVSLCPMVSAYLKRHPEWERLRYIG